MKNIYLNTDFQLIGAVSRKLIAQDIKMLQSIVQGCKIVEISDSWRVYVAINLKKSIRLKLILPLKSRTVNEAGPARARLVRPDRKPDEPDHLVSRSEIEPKN